MTKRWGDFQDIIKELYAEKTLAEVQKIMIEEYNFKASIRAYRGRLIKWGVRKYNRRRSDCSTISPIGSSRGSMSGSDTASPTLSQPTVEQSQDPASYPTSRQARHGESGISNMAGRSYSTVEIDAHRSDTDYYGRHRTLISPSQEIQYEWDLSPTQPTSSSTPTSTMYNHPDIAGTSGTLYGYPPVSPTSSTYPSAAYDESDQTSHDRRASYTSMPARPYSTIHSGSAYPPMRGYRNEHSIAGIGSFDAIREQSNRHI